MRINDGQTVITAGSAGFPDGIPSHQVYVGFSVDDSFEPLGMPVADAVFDRSKSSVIYVVPVVVGVPADNPGTIIAQPPD